MGRPQKYGLPTTGVKVPIELKDTIMFICFKYGELNEKSRIEYIEQLNEKTRNDSVRKCELRRTSKSCEVANTLDCDECPRFK